MEAFWLLAVPGLALMAAGLFLNIHRHRVRR
jgi:hypothetical protein